MPVRSAAAPEPGHGSKPVEVGPSGLARTGFQHGESAPEAFACTAELPPQQVELHVRVALFNRFSQLGRPVTVAMA